MERKSSITRNAGEIFIGLLLVVGLYLTSMENYLLFHSLIELFTIIVAVGIFVIAWNARAYINNNYLLFVGVASVFIAILDLFHTLAYEGMAVFPGDTANLATQLWIAGRTLQSISWLVAPLFLGRRLNLRLQVATYVVVASLLLLSIFYWKVFPVAYIQGVGLTAFKKVSEYAISLIFIGSIAFLVRNRREFDRRVWRLVVLSLCLTIVSEMAFTSYVSVYGEANLIGHLLRLAAFYALYKAVIETGLVRPYAILLRDQQQSRIQLSKFAASLQARNDDLVRTENQLREDGAALQARNEELDAYAHTVAHDLKNPLAVIITTSDVLNEVGDLTPKETRDFLKQIKITAFEMDNIIDGLLLLSEVRTAEAPSEPVDMAKVLHNVRNQLRLLLKENRGRLICQKEWPLVLGYGPWIEEVWANYISNALRYGGPSPRVQLGPTVQADGMVCFWTRDCGPGLSPEDRDSLFTPFAQLRKSRKGGHGLGLSIVLRIVEKLGGQVGVESEVGKGSLFYFTLPHCPDEGRQAAPGEAKEPELA